MFYKQVYKKFAFLEGSDHIASESALKGIEKIILKNKINKIFEFGIGIGTIPYLAKKINNKILYIGTESNSFCIEQLYKNLEDVKDDKFIHLICSNDLDIDLTFDLIIIDGKYDNVDFLKKITHRNSILFVEGDRIDQRKALNSVFPKALISHVISNKKNYKWGPFQSGYMGGYTLYRLNSSSLKNIISNFLERLNTSILYRVRKILLN